MAYINPITLNLSFCSGLCIYQGADWQLPVRLSNRIQTVDTPIDLTGFVGECAIKQYCGDDEPIVMPTVTITNATNGEFTISLTAEQTSGMIAQGRTYKDVATFQYDVNLIKSATGETYRVMQGSVDVSPSCLDSNDGE